MKCCDLVSRLLLLPAARGQDEGESLKVVTVSPPDDDSQMQSGQTVISISQTKDGRLCQFNVDGPVWSQQPQSLDSSCRQQRADSEDEQPPMTRRRLTLPNLYMDCGNKADEAFWRRSTMGRTRNRSRSSWTRIAEGSTRCGRWPSQSASAQWTSTSADTVTTCWQSAKLRQRLGKRQSTCDCPSDVSQATKSSRVWPSVHSFGRCSPANAETSPHDPHRHTVSLWIHYVVTVG